MIYKKHTEDSYLKNGSFFVLFFRKLLQFSNNITELLNICYISINTIDHKQKKE